MLNAWQIRRAVDYIQQDGVIAYPTEAVWGLGCDPYSESAVKRLLALKKRPVEKGLILVASKVAQVEHLLANLTVEQRDTVLNSWPGPNTWLIPDTENLIPEWIKGEHSSVAVRVSDHPLVCALCDRFGRLLVSTSANPATREPALTKTKVNAYFGPELDFVLAGELGGRSAPSVIRDAVSLKTLRS
jgi:L-threonylcarbamoyladenylate synthase